jgi:hypothetical protein
MPGSNFYVNYKQAKNKKVACTCLNDSTVSPELAVKSTEIVKKFLAFSFNTLTAVNSSQKNKIKKLLYDTHTAGENGPLKTSQRHCAFLWKLYSSVKEHLHVCEVCIPNILAPLSQL